MTISTQLTGIPAHIGPAEELGRCVLSSRERNQMEKARTLGQTVVIPPSVFDQEQVWQASVDRLTLSGRTVGEQLGENVAAKRGPNRNFYGWVIVQAAQICVKGIRAVYLPEPDDIYHSEIVLPKLRYADETDRLDFITDLCEKGTWEERPNPVT